MTTLRSLFWTVALLVALLLAALEVGLRATGYSQPIWYQPDPDLGWSLRPGARGRFVDEGQSLVRISPDGMRDRSHALEKPRGTYRIAVLGDSFAEAMQVDYKDSFLWQLESKLAACRFRPGQQVEVLNFGVSGYGLEQARRLLEKRVLKYSPDLVLLVFGHGGVSRPDTVRVLSLPQPWQEVAWEASDRLRAAQFAASIYQKGLIQSAQASAAPALAPSGEALAKLREAALHGGASVAMVTLGQPPAGLHDITAIPIAEDLRAAAQSKRLPLTGFRNSPPGQRPAHWNENGHRAAAEAIASRLCAQGTPR